MKNNPNIHSILNSICSEVWTSKDANKCRALIINHVKNSKINQQDKDKIVSTLNTKNTLNSVWKYFSDALLKYESLGVIK